MEIASLKLPVKEVQLFFYEQDIHSMIEIWFLKNTSCQIYFFFWSKCFMNAIYKQSRNIGPESLEHIYLLYSSPVIQYNLQNKGLVYYLWVYY